MSEENTTPEGETPSTEEAAPSTFNWVAGQDGWGSGGGGGPVEVVYTPDGWVLKES